MMNMGDVAGLVGPEGGFEQVFYPFGRCTGAHVPHEAAPTSFAVHSCVDECHGVVGDDVRILTVQ